MWRGEVESANRKTIDGVRLKTPYFKLILTDFTDEHRKSVKIRGICELELTFRKKKLPAWANCLIKFAASFFAHRFHRCTQNIICENPVRHEACVNINWKPMWMKEPHNPICRSGWSHRDGNRGNNIVKASDEWTDKLHQSGLVTQMVVVSLPDMMKPAALLEYNGDM